MKNQIAQQYLVTQISDLKQHLDLSGTEISSPNKLMKSSVSMPSIHEFERTQQHQHILIDMGVNTDSHSAEDEQLDLSHTTNTNRHSLKQSNLRTKESQCDINKDIIETNLKQEQHNRQLNILLSKLVSENNKLNGIVKHNKEMDIQLKS